MTENKLRKYGLDALAVVAPLISPMFGGAYTGGRLMYRLSPRGNGDNIFVGTGAGFLAGFILPLSLPFLFGAPSNYSSNQIFNSPQVEIIQETGMNREQGVLDINPSQVFSGYHLQKLMFTPLVDYTHVQVTAEEFGVPYTCTYTTQGHQKFPEINLTAEDLRYVSFDSEEGGPTELPEPVERRYEMQCRDAFESIQRKSGLSPL